MENQVQKVGNADSDFMPKPCNQCPYRKDVKPFLRPARGQELAFHTLNKYNTFPCHKTLDHMEDEDTGDCYTQKGANSKECAGFLTLVAVENGEEAVPKGFTPSYDLCYKDAHRMALAYTKK